MKRIVLILLLSFAYVAQAQYLAPMNAKNSGSWSMGLLRIDSSFNLRLFDTAVTKLAFPSNLNNRWARQGQRLYIYNGSFFELADNVPAIDTTSLSTRINARVKYTDTASMLVGYVRAARLNDTALAIRSSIPNVSGKVNYTDTSAMLSPYLRKADTTAMLIPYARKTLVADTAAAIRASIPNVSGKVNYTDTAAMLSGYVRANRLSDTAAAIRSSIPNVSGKVNYSDTAAMLSPYYRTATATAALALKQNLTDTTTWDATKKNLADTAFVLRALIPSAIDTTSLSNRIDARVKYTDTASMLAPYATDAQVALKLNIVDTANMRIRPIAGSNMTITGTYPNVTFAASSTPTDSTRFATNYRVDTAKANLRTSINTKLNSADTASLSARIDLRVKYSDTSAMLGGYLRKVDTSTLSNRINAKLNITDTATMLTNYARKTLLNDTAAAIRAAIPNVSGKVNYTDTASMLSPYYRTAQATAALALKQNYTDTTTWDATKKNLADTALALRALIPSGTDTTSLSNRIDARVKYTDTAAMLGGYLRKVDTASLSNRINLKFNTADTANKWVNSVSKLNDSTIRVIKNTTTTDITISATSTATSATRLVTAVYNKSGATITKGSVVYIDGAHSSVLPSIALAKANQESTSAYTYGLVENDIPNNSQGVVIQSGAITNLNLPTSTYTDGQTLYLSPTVAGGYTLVKPLAPNHYVSIGTITRAHPTLGTIQIAIRNGFQLDELSDVQIPLVPNDSDLLQFTRVDSLWKNVSVTTAIGNKYIKPSDTSAMLSSYLRKVDTVSLSTRINTKLNSADTASLSTRIDARVKYSDTATMLSPYYRTATATAALATKVNYTDTAAMLGGYLRKVDTSTLSNRINLKLNSADTASLSNRINLKLNSTDTASLSNRINAKVGYGTLTTNYVPKATSITAIGNSQIFDNGTSVGINTATPLAATKLHINSTTNVSLDGGDLRIDNSTNDAASITLNCTGTFGQRYTVFSSAQAFGSQGGFGVYDHTSAFSSLISNGSNEVGTLAIRGKSVGGASVSINSSAAGGTTWAIISNATASGRAGMLTFWNGAHRIFFTGTGQIGVGAAPNASSILDLTSTTQGLLLPRMTTTQINAIATPAAGLTVYNTTLALICFYNGTAWQRVTAIPM